MDVRKTNGSYEEFDNEKLKRGIREAYKATGQKCPEEVVVSITDNLYIYDKISSQEIRRQVVDSLMSINKKAAREYIEKFDYNHFLDSLETIIAVHNECLNYVDNKVAEKLQHKTKTNLKELTVKFLTNIKYNKRG